MKWHHAKLVTLAATAVLLATATDLTGDVVGDSGDNVAAVRRAWADRQARVKSGKFVVAEKRTITKGARTPPEGKLKGTVIPKGVVIPPEDTTFDVPMVIAFDGERYRFEYTDKIRLSDKRQSVDRTYTATCNESVCKTLYSLTARGWPQGQILPATEPTDLNGPAFPVLITYRPFNPHGALAKGGLLPLVEQPKCLIDGRECLVFNLGRHSNVKIAVCVDPAMDYSIVRFSITVQGELRSNANIRYQRTADFGWVPSEWDFTRNREGSPELCAAEVKEYSLNRPLPRDLFDIQFPPGHNGGRRAVQSAT
jgi:hypothetical protein